MLKNYSDISGKNTGRIEAIADGIFSVGLTLLVLDIKVPYLESIHSESELIKAFCALTPRFLTYFLSFLTLGIFWVGHTTQFSYIEKSDRRFNWIVLFFLLSVSLLPFTTAFLSEFIQYRFSILLYWFNIFLMGVLIFTCWEYAYRNDLITVSDKEKKEEIYRIMRRRIITAQLLYATGAALCFINIYVSIGFIILVELYYAFGMINIKKK